MSLTTFPGRLIRFLSHPDRVKRQLDLWMIQRIPRYQEFQTNILKRPVKGVDSASFGFMFDEIFKKEIYRFNCDSETPFIIDCGANIGLSVIYFKQLFPGAKILAFEPDQVVFKTLKENISSFGFSDVDVSEKAVWDSETTLEFMAEGADGGRVVETDGIDLCKYSVDTIRLRNYLTKPVDFLKLDIEGAETRVIQDCQDLLPNIKNLFIEYHSFADRPQTLHILTTILFEAGFRVFIHPPVVSPRPFVIKSVHMGMDMQLNLFALNER